MFNFRFGVYAFQCTIHRYVAAPLYAAMNEFETKSLKKRQPNK
jgi:hypothetical protein